MTGGIQTNHMEKNNKTDKDKKEKKQVKRRIVIFDFAYMFMQERRSLTIDK